jgi:hypothetical protein
LLKITIFIILILSASLSFKGINVEELALCFEPEDTTDAEANARWRPKCDSTEAYTMCAAWFHALANILVSIEMYVLAVYERELSGAEEAKQSVGWKWGHMTPACCPSTCSTTNASLNVAGEMSTSMRILLSPASFPKIVAQYTDSSSMATAQKSSDFIFKTDDKPHRWYK